MRKYVRLDDQIVVPVSGFGMNLLLQLYQMTIASRVIDAELTDTSLSHSIDQLTC